MIHLYLSSPSGETEGHPLVDEILALNAGIGLVEAPGDGDEMARRVAAAHITACEGMIAIVTDTPNDHQRSEIRSALDADIPLLLLANTADLLAGEPVEVFTPEVVLAFIDALRNDKRASTKQG